MKKYAYILSQRYSGSTLLTFLLSTHPEISTIGERRKFYNKVIRAEDFQHHKAKHCSCGELFIDCEYLNSIKTDVMASISERSLKHNATEFKLFDNKYLNKIAYETHKSLEKYRISPMHKRVKAQQEVNIAIVQSILSRHQSSVFLDSSKVINHAFYLSQIPNFDFHAIWLVRDPRAQINSAMKYNTWTLERATKLWKKEMKTNARVLKAFGIKYQQIRYTDLCAQPELIIGNIMDFIGLSKDGFSLQFRDQEHHIMGNHMRLEREQKIVERKEWKKRLSSKDLAYINKETKDFSSFYSD